MPRYTITIDTEYGSPFQENAVIKMLEVQIKAWKEFVLAYHKKSKVEFTLKKES
jgi:hypothetical protein